MKRARQYTSEEEQFCINYRKDGMRHREIIKKFIYRFNKSLSLNSLKDILKRSSEVFESRNYEKWQVDSVLKDAVRYQEKLNKLRNNIFVGSKVKLECFEHGKDFGEVMIGNVVGIHPEKLFVVVRMKNYKISCRYEDIIQIL